MASTLNTPGLVLDIGAGRGVSERLYRALRKAVVDGRLRTGEKLPSTRELAASLAEDAGARGFPRCFAQYRKRGV